MDSERDDMENDHDDFDVWKHKNQVWWQASLLLNTILMGDGSEPVCSRVYRKRPSIFRKVFLRVMDMVFQEDNHCRRVHDEWMQRYWG